MDAITIDIPISFISSAAANLSKMGMAAGMMNINVDEAEETNDSTLKQVYEEKNQIVNFLQKMKSKTSMRTYMSDPNEKALEKLKAGLKASRLAVPIKNENKQRASVQLILNAYANEKMTYTEFYALIRQADLFNMFTDMGTGFKENYITAGNILKLLPKIKDKISPYD